MPLGSSTDFAGPTCPELSPFGTASGLSTPGCYSPLGVTSRTFDSFNSRVGYLCPEGPPAVAAETAATPGDAFLFLVEGTSRILDTSSAFGKSLIYFYSIV